MNKLLFTILLSFWFSVNSLGQITISTDDMPNDGDTLRYSIAPNFGSYSATNTGANYTWDFSDLDFSNQGVLEYKRSSSTPYILNFGFSALGLKIADTIGIAPLQFQNVYAFYKNSSSKYEIVGSGFQYSALPLPQSGKHDDPDELFLFPLEFGDSNETTFDVKVDLKAGFLTIGSYIQSGTRTTVVDGWGKISTPYAKNVDCIRVKSIIDGFDSIAVTTPAVNFGTNNKRVEYRWMSKTERMPILEILGTEINGNFIPNSIRYRDSFRTRSNEFLPKAIFSMAKDTVLIGENVELGHQSTGAVTETEWKISTTQHVYTRGDKNADEADIEFTNSGNYTITLVVGNALVSDSLTKNIVVLAKNPVGISRVSILGDIQIIPNPSFGTSQIIFPNHLTVHKMVLVDFTGKQVKELKISDKIQFVDWSQMNGIYWLRVETSEGTINRKLVIQK